MDDLNETDTNPEQDALTYSEKEPDIDALQTAYERTVNDLDSYFDLCRQSYDDRNNWWPGKSRDLRKHGADAFPWEGASDMEAHVIDERQKRLVALFMSALNRANVRAFPVEATDTPRSQIVSGFLKWMLSSGYIPRFMREMELGANYLLERGILVTYVGWQREDRRYLQRLNLEQIIAVAPEISELIADPANDDELILLLKQTFEGVTDQRGKTALRELRELGTAELPITRRQIDAPEVKTLAPDGDFFFPNYVTDPQRAPFCFWRTYYTPQELRNKISTDGWDEDFVKTMIEKYQGVNADSVEREQENRRASYYTTDHYEAEELIEIIYGYQRLVDPVDNSEGIYCTVYHKEFNGDANAQGYAKFELLNGYEDYPVVITRFAEDTKRLYDATTLPQLLKGIQNQIKLERDSRIDRNSLATLPPLMHPVGNKPTDYGPGRNLPYRRRGELEFAPQPPFNAGSVEIEQTLQAQGDRLLGLDETARDSQIRLQFLVDKFLSHTAEVIKMAYRAFQRFGPDAIFFRVTGAPEGQQFTKGNPDENFDIHISFDVLQTDPETTEKKLQQLLTLSQMDRNGKFDVDALLSIAAYSIDPVLADSILQPSQKAQEQIVQQVMDDLTKIYSGIEMPARINGAQIALQTIQQYTQQPDIQERLQNDESFAQRLQKYAGQYQFQMQQMQNAQIGKIGTAPAQMGGMPTQQMNPEA